MEGAARTYLAEILIAAGDYAGAEREAAAAIATLAGRRRCRSRRWACRRARGSAAATSKGRWRPARAAHERWSGSARLRRASRWSGWRSPRRSISPGARDDARRALAVAHQRLLERADRIEEPAWRHRFLHAVPVNARILALAEEWRALGANALEASPPAAAPIAQP